MVAMLYAILYLAVMSEVNSQLETTVSPKITVCETESLPTAFTVMCTARMAPATLVFKVSGIRDVGTRTVTSISDLDYYTYSSSSNTEAALIVNDPTNAEVMNGTCFQCADLSGNNPISNTTCVNVTQSPPCVTNVTVQSMNETALTVSWTNTMSENYAVTVCQCGAQCELQSDDLTNVSTTVTGLTPGTCYVIQVESFIQNCMSRNCMNNGVETNTAGVHPPPPPPDNLWWIVLIVVPLPIILAVIVVVLVVYKKKKSTTRSGSSEMTEYADPEIVRNKKEETKKDELMYVTPTFSKENENTVKKPKKMDDVEYTGVQLA